MSTFPIFSMIISAQAAQHQLFSSCGQSLTCKFVLAGGLHCCPVSMVVTIGKMKNIAKQPKTALYICLEVPALIQPHPTKLQQLECRLVGSTQSERSQSVGHSSAGPLKRARIWRTK